MGQLVEVLRSNGSWVPAKVTGTLGSVTASKPAGYLQITYYEAEQSKKQIHHSKLAAYVRPHGMASRTRSREPRTKAHEKEEIPAQPGPLERAVEAELASLSRTVVTPRVASTAEARTAISGDTKLAEKACVKDATKEEELEADQMFQSYLKAAEDALKSCEEKAEAAKEFVEAAQTKTQVWQQVKTPTRSLAGDTAGNIAFEDFADAEDGEPEPEMNVDAGSPAVKAREAPVSVDVKAMNPEIGDIVEVFRSSGEWSTAVVKSVDKHGVVVSMGDVTKAVPRRNFGVHLRWPAANQASQPERHSTCKNGHEMLPITAWTRGTCDSCQADVKKGQWIFECKKCRPIWWICESCDQPKASVASSAERKPDVKLSALELEYLRKEEEAVAILKSLEETCSAGQKRFTEIEHRHTSPSKSSSLSSQPGNSASPRKRTPEEIAWYQKEISSTNRALMSVIESQKDTKEKENLERIQALEKALRAKERNDNFLKLIAAVSVIVLALGYWHFGRA
jgi:hypothetical protein